MKVVRLLLLQLIFQHHLFSAAVATSATNAKLRGVTADDSEDEGGSRPDFFKQPATLNTEAMNHLTDNIGSDATRRMRSNLHNGTVIQLYQNEREMNIFSGRTRIIGGMDASNLPGDYSFAVSLQDSTGKHFCGASLISKDCILTTAHCTNTVTRNSQISAVVGRYNLANTGKGERLNIKLEKLHPLYDVALANVAWDYDFAIMCFTKPTTTNSRIIQLNRNSSVPVIGGQVRVLGWGDTNPSENIRTPSNELQVASLRTVSNAKCDATTGIYGTYSISFKGQIENSMMCAWSESQDACQGDSGGPLIHRGKLVGLTSWGVGCNDGLFPGVYARVSTAYPWIRRNICSLSAHPDPSFQCGSLQD